MCWPAAAFTDWRTQLHAELAQGGGFERLTKAERLRIDEGRSFEQHFGTAGDVQPLAWQWPGAKCEIAYFDNDPNPWCRCMATIPATVVTVFQEIWALDCEAMCYDAHVQYRILDRPSTHSVDWVFRVHIVSVLPAFEAHLSGTWVQSTLGGQK